MSPATNLGPETGSEMLQVAREPVHAMPARTVAGCYANHVRALFNVLNGEVAMATVGHVAGIFTKRDGLISLRYHLHCACAHLGM